MDRRVATAIAAAGIFWLPATASAADLPQAPASPAPVYTKAPAAAPFGWTGFYVGGNVGYGPGIARNNISFSQTNPPFVGDLASFGATDSVKVNGVNGGAQAGYNWQISNFVFGIETDIQASGEKGTNTFNGTILNQSTTNFGDNAATISDSNKLEWFGTTRARFGLAMDRWLVYGTGGVAYGEISQTGNVQPATNFPTVTINGPIVWNQSTTKVGWAVGGGVENAITRNWSWKVEYLFMDLGTTTAPLSGGTGSIGQNCYGHPGAVNCNPFSATSGTVISRFTDNIVRLGVNYKFN
jgi:outer membrane immunogenic protein